MVTYARLPARELYHVSNPGIDTRIKRGLAFAGFPAAPVAVAVVWLLPEHLTRRVVTVAAVAATVLPHRCSGLARWRRPTPIRDALLVTSSLWLSRHLHRMGNPTHRRILAGYLSLLIAYGGANALQDFWLEQIVKRDLAGWQFPYMLQPKANWAFLGIAAGAASIYWILLRSGAILDRSGPAETWGRCLRRAEPRS